MTEERPGEFRIHFYDSRLYSVIVEAENSACIKDQVRLAVLRRLSGMNRYVAPQPGLTHG